MSSKKIVIALGGNALGDDPKTQKENACFTAKQLIPLIKNGYEIVIAHGNGPQVGLINLAFEEGNKANNRVYSMPFPECGAMSQGYIGYHLQNALKNELMKNSINKNVCTIITQVEVNKDDNAFLNPSKPIGSFYKYEDTLNKPFIFKEDALRGYRRVVPSPKPISIIEKDTILDLINASNIVITVGGGGIPVIINSDKTITGVDAVIDKDFASAKLAELIEADYLVILTAVDKVSLNYHLPNQINLDYMTIFEAEKYIQEGHFYAGSMLPKIEAAINFVKTDKNRKAVITTIENASRFEEDSVGTKISW